MHHPLRVATESMRVAEVHTCELRIHRESFPTDVAIFIGPLTEWFRCRNGEAKKRLHQGREAKENLAYKEARLGGGHTQVRFAAALPSSKGSK